MNPTTPPLLSPPGWFRRNWLWFVPSLVVVLMIIGAAFVASILFLVFGMMRNSEPYKVAMEVAGQNPRVVQHVGTPVQEGWFLMGNINFTGSSADADLAIPIAGPSGSATLYVIASKSAGRWTFSTLTCEFKASGERISLLSDLPASDLEEHDANALPEPGTR